MPIKGQHHPHRIANKGLVVNNKDPAS